MKKKILLLIAVMVVCANVSLASGNSSAVNTAIKKYKGGNYTGCLQDMQLIVKRDPSNAIAYYYIAMSYAQAGQRDKAIESYQKVLTLKPNNTISNYATMGKRCLESPDKCKEAEDMSDIDKLIAAPLNEVLSPKVKYELEQKRLQSLKDVMNKDKEIDNYELKKFSDFDKKSENVQPSNDEIVAALRVLNKAGITINQAANNNPYAQMAQMVSNNPQINEMSMMMNSGNSMGGNNNNNNAMMNMLPFMLAQNGKDGKANAYTPQLMQTMMMNSMLPDFNFNTDKN